MTTSARDTHCGSSAEHAPMCDAPRRWQDDAACKDVGWEVFYPADGEGYGLAARYCLSCHVKAECLEWALANEREGFWGGHSPEERHALRKGAERRQWRTDRNHLAVVDEGAAVAEAFRGIVATLAAGR